MLSEAVTWGGDDMKPLSLAPRPKVTRERRERVGEAEAARDQEGKGRAAHDPERGTQVIRRCGSRSQVLRGPEASQEGHVWGSGERVPEPGPWRERDGHGVQGERDPRA